MTNCCSLETTPATLTDLPAELLHMICGLLADDASQMRTFSCVCRHVREVALEYLDFRRMTVQDVNPFEPLVRFLRSYPRVAKTVVSLRILGVLEYNEEQHANRFATTIDDTHVASVMEFLPNLDALTLARFQFAIPSLTASTCVPGPFSLSNLEISGEGDGQSSLTCVFRVLSLFTLGRLGRIRLGEFFNADAPFQDHLLHRPLDIRQLLLPGHLYSSAHLLALLRAFAVSLKNDSLQVLRVRIPSSEAVLALGELLRRAGCNITTLEIDPSYLAILREHGNWAYLFKDNWRMLHVSSCTQLESISLPIHFNLPEEPVCESVAGILSQQASSTLRKVTLCATGLARLAKSGNMTVYNLHDLDEVLSATRFPHLRQCVIQNSPYWLLHCQRQYWPECEAAVQSALKGLHARGLLKIVFRE